MRPAEIRAELIRRDQSFASVARDLGVSRVHVGQVISGKRRSPRVEEAVAAAIELPIEDVFGPIPSGAAA